MPRTSATVNKSGQIKAKAAAKSARIEEAGLGGRRTGRESARTRRAQGGRDAKAAAAGAEMSRRANAAAAAANAAEAPKGKKPAAAARAAPRQRGRVLTVQVNTSNTVTGDETFVAQARETIRTALGHLGPRLTRVEAHFDDVNAAKGGADDKRCTIEARPASMRPLSASATAATSAQALRGAVGKVKRLLTTRLAKAARR
jgi:hypothetical protein